MLVQLLIFIVVLVLLLYVLRLVPLERPWREIVYAILVAVVVIYLIGWLVPLGPWGYHRP